MQRDQAPSPGSAAAGADGLGQNRLDQYAYPHRPRPGAEYQSAGPTTSERDQWAELQASLPFRDKGKSRVSPFTPRPLPIYTPQDSEAEDTDTEAGTVSDLYAVASTVDSAFSSRAPTPTQRDFLKRNIDSRIPALMHNDLPRTPLSEADRQDFAHLIMLIHDYIGQLGEDDVIEPIYSLFIELNHKLHEAQQTGSTLPILRAENDASFHDEQVVRFIPLVESRNPPHDKESDDEYDLCIFMLADLAARLLSVSHPIYLAKEQDLRMPKSGVQADPETEQLEQARLRKRQAHQEMKLLQRNTLEMENPIRPDETEMAYRERIDWLLAVDLNRYMNPSMEPDRPAAEAQQDSSDSDDDEGSNEQRQPGFVNHADAYPVRKRIRWDLPPAAKRHADERHADEQPADERHADEQPADERHADEQPVDERPVDERPADERPVDERPADDKHGGPGNGKISARDARAIEAALHDFRRGLSVRNATPADLQTRDGVLDQTKLRSEAAVVGSPGPALHDDDGDAMDVD